MPYAEDQQPVIYTSIGIPNKNLLILDTIYSSATLFMPIYNLLSKDAVGSSNHRDFNKDSVFIPL